MLERRLGAYPRVAGPAALVSAVVLATVGSAYGQPFGNVCVRDFQAGAVCTANDVRIQALNLISIVETCEAGIPGEAEANFEVFVSAVGAPDRYDIAMFVALDGLSARDGDSCFHDFLEPPLTPTPTYGDANGDGVADLDGGPWLDTDLDLCGDIAAGTQLFKVIPTLRVACVDTNANGIVDASVCTSWDNNAVTNCSGLAEAFPGTNAKCGCARLDLGIPMPLASPSPSPGPLPPPVPDLPDGWLIGLAALLAAAGFLLIRRQPFAG